MAAWKAVSILEHFANLPDPRVERTRRHELLDIIVIAICAVICACESWEDIAEYGQSKRNWFQTFLRLPNGIPSHDTFRRVFNRLDPRAFHDCFVSWVTALSEAHGVHRIAIDGKTLRHSFDHAAGKAALHLVSAWATEAHLTLGQVAVDTKSNEITAIPRLLALLDLTGALVTIDAMGCQKEIARQIRAAGGDYVLAVKENQERLYADVRQCFERALENDFVGVESDVCETVEEGHGRRETRTCYTITHPDGVRDAALWQDLRSICVIISERMVGPQTQEEARFYIGSFAGTAKDYLEAVRGHWGIENGLHWILDVTFREDASRIRKEHGPENVALLRRLALSLLKKEPTSKRSIRGKQLKAGWDNDYLLRVLCGSSAK
jgi:predicted transposase YbfD/YdcC